jgi:MFS family permease
MNDDAASNPVARPWRLAFATVSLVQMEASFLTVCLPICGPALTSALGLAPQRIGVIGGTVWAGSLAFVLIGGFILDRLPPVRLFQIVLLASAIGLGLAMTGSTTLLFVGAFVIGVAYGPNVPAGSLVLAERMPRNRSGLLFSLKQGAVSIGNTLAGLILAPLAAYAGYRDAVLLAIVTGVIAALCLTPLARHLAVAARRPVSRSLGTTIIAPLTQMIRSKGLPPRAVLAFAMASAQGITTNLLVAYLVTKIGLTLTVAGFVFAVLQCGGFLGRVLCGWLADVTGTPGRNLAIQALISAASMLALATLAVHETLIVVLPIALLTGISAFGWNGVFIAEAARLSPRGAVAETTAGAVSVIYLANMVAPASADIIISISHSWRLAFVVAACVAAGLGLAVILTTSLTARIVR